jgi:hypothetical protein
MQMTEGISPKCGLCNEIETTDHLFECSGRTGWREQLYRDLFKYLTKHQTSPVLKKVIMQGLRWEFEGHSPEFELEIENQTRIGWRHLIRGWIDKGWQKFQEKYLSDKFPNDKCLLDAGKDWSLKLIEFLWHEGHKLWTDRCDKVHKKLKQTETAQQRRTANAKVTALYKQAEDVGYYDRHKLFGLTLKTKLRESAKSLQQWVVRATPAIKQASREHSQRTIRNTQDIRGFIAGTAAKVTIATRLGIFTQKASTQSSTTNNNNAPT